MKRIVIMGNSMSMPRPQLDREDCSHISDVYGELLSDLLRAEAKIDLTFVNSLDSQNARENFFPMVSYREPDVVILHIGIIDCAPRLFRKGSKHLFLQPWFRSISRDIGMRAFKKYRRQVTRFRRIVYVKPAAFERNMIELREKVRQFKPDARVCALAIAEVADWLAERNYGYIDNIRTYNDILRRVFAEEFIELNDLLPKDEMFISDGYHFSLAMHQRVAQRIAGHIERD